MDEILKLTQEKSTWLFLAEGLTQEHQQSVKLDILRKVDNLQSQINELKRAKADSSDELGDCNMPRVSGSCFGIRAEERISKKRVIIKRNMTRETAEAWLPDSATKKIYRYFRVVDVRNYR